ncbi:hypothetical protein WNY78_11190 [Psychroserpens sp. AS72]|uniref:hypothetical protein n=1 Tax=Psychroserpens sp. AS72 TaxID=3135775 RepID=UPI00317887C0
MKARTKAHLITFSITIGIYLAIVLLLKYVIGLKNLGLVIIIGSIMTAILAPKQQIVEKQSGKEVHLKWRFSKNGYIFKSKL